MSTTIICMRQADMPIPAAQAIRKNCTSCGEPVWLGYSALLATASDKEEPILHCMHCARQTISDARSSGEDVTFMPPTDLQIKEVKNALDRW